MNFAYLKSANFERFYIYLNNNPFFEFNHENIAKKLNIGFGKYLTELKNFNVVYNEVLDNLYFNTKEDAENAKNYLNDKYAIMFKLIGG